MLSVKEAYNKLRSVHSGYVGEWYEIGKQYYWFDTDDREGFINGRMHKVDKESGKVSETNSLEWQYSDDFPEPDYCTDDGVPEYSLKEILAESEAKRGV